MTTYALIMTAAFGVLFGILLTNTEKFLPKGSEKRRKKESRVTGNCREFLNYDGSRPNPVGKEEKNGTEPS